MKTSDSGSGAGKVSEGLGLLSTIISSLSFYKNEISFWQSMDEGLLP